MNIYEKDLRDYCDAMANSDVDRCIQIEQENDLYGYPPEVVTVALSAAMRGEDMYAAVDEYIGGSTESP